VYSVLGSVTRRDSWEPPEAMRAVSVLGSIVLDYRNADLPLGLTTLDCVVYLGSVEIVVPPDIDVELTGSVLLGSVDAKAERGRSDWLRRAKQRLLGEGDERDADDERPLLSIDCSGFLGSVAVRVR
jgi:predicted membrane protein